MVDLDAVLISIRSFCSIATEVILASGLSRKRVRIQHVEGCGGKKSRWNNVAGKGITEPVEDCSKSSRLVSTNRMVKPRLTRNEQFRKVSHSHLRRRNCDERKLSASECRCAVSLPIVCKEKERAISTVVKIRGTFSRTRQEDRTADHATKIVSVIVWRIRIVCRFSAPNSPLIELVRGSMYYISSGLEGSRYDCPAGAPAFGRGHARLNLEFLYSVSVWKDRDLAKLRF